MATVSVGRAARAQALTIKIPATFLSICLPVDVRGQEQKVEELGCQGIRASGWWLVASWVREAPSFPGMLSQAPLAHLGKQEWPDNMEVVSQTHPV